MFYVSSIKGGKVGVTDTTDGVEEFYNESQILKFITDDSIIIYGTCPFDGSPNCKVLRLGIGISSDDISRYLYDCKSHYSHALKARYIDDLLASAKVGTKIRMSYTDKMNYTHICTFTKLDCDYWKYSDPASLESKKDGNSRFASSLMRKVYNKSATYCNVMVI